MPRMAEIERRSEETTAPSATPVTLAEAKSWLKVDHTDLDTEIGEMIQAATEYAQDVLTRHQLMVATRKDYLYQFPEDDIVLFRSPVSSITSITYTDTAGDSQTLGSTTYELWKRKPARVRLAEGEVWPATKRTVDAVIVTYVCGYADAASVPEKWKHGLFYLINHLFENRNQATERALSEIPLGVKAWLGSGRLISSRV